MGADQPAGYPRPRGRHHDASGGDHDAAADALISLSDTDSARASSPDGFWAPRWRALRAAPAGTRRNGGRRPAHPTGRPAGRHHDPLEPPSRPPLTPLMWLYDSDCGGGIITGALLGIWRAVASSTSFSAGDRSRAHPERAAFGLEPNENPSGSSMPSVAASTMRPRRLARIPGTIFPRRGSAAIARGSTTRVCSGRVR